ncbi:MAG: hypothetical protein CM15mP102_05740 [Flavobacteriales bacterium]|nr:MAG: hypothetical protein CM15mP102_05740 [Flavobacteriales bacterium]
MKYQSSIIPSEITVLLLSLWITLLRITQEQFFREEALYFRWLSQYEIAINSIESRINDRITELERSLEKFF